MKIKISCNLQTIFQLLPFRNIQFSSFSCWLLALFRLARFRSCFVQILSCNFLARFFIFTFGGFFCGWIIFFLVRSIIENFNIIGIVVRWVNNNEFSFATIIFFLQGGFCFGFWRLFSILKKYHVKKEKINTAPVWKLCFKANGWEPHVCYLIIKYQMNFLIGSLGRYIAIYVCILYKYVVKKTGMIQNKNYTFSWCSLLISSAMLVGAAFSVATRSNNFFISSISRLLNCSWIKKNNLHVSNIKDIYQFSLLCCETHIYN